jgi:hypothetical protein
MISGGAGTPTYMTDSPSEQAGVPAEEGIEHADVRGDIGTDPERVPNAPNRDPAVPPDSADVGSGDDPDLPKGFESFDEQAEHRGNYAQGTSAPNPPH